ncbi:MAG: 1-acyl-sn-glycerol-3-phosphate acyltransferase [Cyclobacteriaceae bacterium]
MIKSVFRAIFRLNGWHISSGIPPESGNCIMVAAPHTSNWDLIYAMAALDKLGINTRFTIKKEFNKFPFSYILSSMGALWIDRTATKNKNLKMTDIMAAFFESEEAPLAMLVTAEGTRSPVSQWKTGFYYTAVKANVPICLSYLDYKKKEAGIGLCFMPSGDIESDMRKIMAFYSGKTARFPEKFKPDERYS